MYLSSQLYPFEHHYFPLYSKKFEHPGLILFHDLKQTQHLTIILPTYTKNLDCKYSIQCMAESNPQIQENIFHYCLNHLPNSVPQNGILQNLAMDFESLEWFQISLIAYYIFLNKTQTFCWRIFNCSYQWQCQVIKRKIPQSI